MKKYFLLPALIFLTIVSYSQLKVLVPEKQNLTQVKEQQKTVAFRLVPFNQLSLPSAGATTLNVSVKEFDVSNNTRGNTFVAPENGIYHFDVRLNIIFAITDYTNFLRFHLSLLNGSSTIEKTTLMNAQTPNSPTHTLMISTTVSLAKGDVVSAVFSADANPGTGAVTASSASFSGFKVTDIQNTGQADRIR